MIDITKNKISKIISNYFNDHEETAGVSYKFKAIYKKIISDITDIKIDDLLLFANQQIRFNNEVFMDIYKYMDIENLLLEDYLYETITTSNWYLKQKIESFFG